MGGKERFEPWKAVDAVRKSCYFGDAATGRSRRPIGLEGVLSTDYWPQRYALTHDAL